MNQRTISPSNSRKLYIIVFVLGVIGATLFITLLVHNNLAGAARAIASAGWGVALVIAFHGAVLLTNVFAWRVLFPVEHRLRTSTMYCAGLRSNYRKQIRRSQKLFQAADASIEVFSGAAIAENFTDDIHKLYLAVRDRAAYRMEELPAEFFRETARRFGKDATLTLCRLDGRVVGFSFGIFAGQDYHDLYVGLDYAHNAELDIYFNIYYHDLDRIFRRGCRRMYVGQTSDAFKSRLGCEPRRLWFYVRALNPLIHVGLRGAAGWIFPPVVHLPPRDIYLAAYPNQSSGKRHKTPKVAPHGQPHF